MAHPSRRAAATLGFCQRGKRFVVCQTSRDDGVVTPLDQGKQTGLQRYGVLASEVRQMACKAQQALHPEGPVFLLDLDQRLQFAQVMRVA